MAVLASEIEIKLALIRKFPGLAKSQFAITSNPDPYYNCIAWAAGRIDQFWWPGIFWPKGAPKKVTLDAFIKVFQGIGYEVCDNPKPEAGCEKVAFYEAKGAPTHAARLLETGMWTSKLGSSHDISHTLEGLSGDEYGEPTVFMRR